MNELAEVVAYDPNELNPYGVEVCAILTEIADSVTLWTTVARTVAPVDGLKIVNCLARSGDARPARRKPIWRRLFAPLHLVFTTPRSTPLVAIWIRDPWDALLFGLRAQFGGRMLIIHHNPVQVRPRPGVGGVMEKWAVSRAIACTHSPRLASLTLDYCSKVAVTPHPPFSVTTRDAHRTTKGALNNRAIFAFIGGLREDKGVGELVAIASASGGGWDLLILGPDRLAEAIVRSLSEVDVGVRYVADDRGPSDRELIDGLLASQAVLAPYVAMTESSSIILAFTLGVPVLSFDSPALENRLTSQSVAKDATSLGLTMQRFIKAPWPTYTGLISAVHDASVAGWRNALANA